MIKGFHLEPKTKQDGDLRHKNNVVALSDEGKVRQANEDDWGVANTPNGYLFVVCDGMGGHAGGQMASKIAVEKIIEHFQKRKYSNPQQALNDALQFANIQILGYASDFPELKGMGTTACVLLLQRNKAYIAHVGDSRIYLYLGKEKELHRLTKDHSFVQTLVDKWNEGIKKGVSEKQLRDEELIPDCEAENHPNKNRILKALGIKPELKPTVCEKPIKPKNDDIFLLCTDGLNGEISDKSIQNILSENPALIDKGDTLIKRARDGENGQDGGRDNITVKLIQIDSAPKWRWRSKFESCNPVSNGQSGGSNWKKFVKWVVGAIVVLAVGFGVWFYFDNIRENINTSREERRIIGIQNKISDKEAELLRRRAVNEDYSEVENEIRQLRKQLPSEY